MLTKEEQSILIWIQFARRQWEKVLQDAIKDMDKDRESYARKILAEMESYESIHPNNTK